ncbi:Peptidase, S9A/B/C family, catalytic domain protein [Candidatus Magnetomoraceae bacterium gMMP-15]
MKLLLTAGYFFGFVIILLFLLQHKMIYFPRRYDLSFSPDFKKVIELSYNTDQGSQTAFYFPSQSGVKADRLWVLFNGNAALALDWLVLITHLNFDKKFDFLLIDYPGYGKCKGKADPKSILDSSEKAFNKLSEYLGIKPDELEKNLNVMGHSLGAATALQFAVNHPINQVILLSPFTSLIDMATRIVGWPLCYISRHKYDNKERLSDLALHEKIPKVTIIHGDNDETVPVEMGRKLATIFPEMITYIEIPNTDHNSIIMTAKKQIFNAMKGNYE